MGNGGAYLPNPASGQAEWFHGSPHAFDEFDNELFDPYYDDGEKIVKHWNTHMGYHFTSLRGVAERFAKGEYQASGDVAGGFIYKAQLQASNPKVYARESDMNREVWDRARDWIMETADEIWDEDAGEYRAPVAPDPDDVAALDAFLTSHPLADEISDLMLNMLRKQGHDAVIYGNDIETPIGHQCVIVFDRKQILRMTRTLARPHLHRQDDTVIMPERANERPAMKHPQL